MKDSVKTKVVIHICEECHHEWFAKKEEHVCPECNSVYLAIEMR